MEKRTPTKGGEWLKGAGGQTDVETRDNERGERMRLAWETPQVRWKVHLALPLWPNIGPNCY